MSKFKTASPTGTAENPMVVLKRLLRYLKPYRLRLAVVFLCIIFSALASTISATFLKTLINDYIAPLLLESHADYSGLLSMILKMAVIFAGGAICTLLYIRLMVPVSQGVLKKIRDDMFTHMQKLPVRYFDQNATGDIMSLYTNDTDTLRQMMAQSFAAVHLFHDYDCGCVCCDAGNKCLAHAVCHCLFDFYDGDCQACWRKEWKIFRSTAGIVGRCKRLCRRNDSRAEGRESIFATNRRQLLFLMRRTRACLRMQRKRTVSPISSCRLQTTLATCNMCALRFWAEYLPCTVWAV